MEQLDVLLRRVNPYAAMYKNMSQVAIEEERQALEEGRSPLTVSMVIHNDGRIQDERRDNSPAGEEIAVVFESIDGAPPENKDIRGRLLIPQRGKEFIKINTQKPMCDPVTFPYCFQMATMDGIKIKNEEIPMKSNMIFPILTERSKTYWKKRLK